MFGTVARMRIKEGKRPDFQAVLDKQELEAQAISGLIADYVFWLDRDERAVIMVTVFDSREAYFANARDPDQDRRFRELRELLVEDPEWNDGEIDVVMRFGTPRPGR